jgi:SYP5 family syntaxin
MRKADTLTSKLDALRTDLVNAVVTERESRRRENMLRELRTRSDDLALAMNGPSTSPLTSPAHVYPGESHRVDVDEDNEDNRSILQLQRNLMREQDEELEELSRVVTSTKHIGLAVGEELDLHARLLDDLETDVERSGSMLRRAHALARRVYENSGGGCKFFALSSALVAVLVCLVILIEKTKKH